MKTWKQGFIGIVVLVFVFSACKDNNETAHTHVWGEWQTIPPTCENDGYDIRICSTDNTHTETKNPTAALGHNYQWDITTPATTYVDGEETETCTRCGATRDTRPIDKLLQTHDLNLGTIPVVLEDQTGQLPAERVIAIQAALTTFANSIDAVDMGAMTLLTGRNIRIIIEDVPVYSNGNTRYRVVDGNTMCLRYESLITANDAQTRGPVRDGLRAMSAINVE